MDFGFEFLDFVLMLLLIGFEFLDFVLIRWVLIRDLGMNLSFFGCFDLDLVRIWYVFDLNFSRYVMGIDLCL